MKHIRIAQHTVKDLFTHDNGTFVVPFYQRPYSWTEEQCLTLWYDVDYFAFPNGRADKFNRDVDEWYLGNMVTYPNDQKQDEVVDGQQRIITLLLLMRAFYEDLHDSDTGKELGKCIWHAEEDGSIDMTRPRIESKAILETGQNSLKQILVSGNAKAGDKSNYAVNYRYFREKIAEFKAKTPDNLWLFAARLLNNVCVSRMEADSEEQALQLFLTINDRGMSLRIADIFQAKLFEDVKNRDGDAETQLFLTRWQSLSELCNKIFNTNAQMLPIEFAFLLYANSTIGRVKWRDMKQLYSQNDYALLKSPQTLKGIDAMLSFFSSLRKTGSSCFVPDGIARKVHVLLRSAPDMAWYMLAAYFFKHHGEKIFDDELENFLERVIAYLLGKCAVGEQSIVRHPQDLTLCLAQFTGKEPFAADKKFSEELVRHNLKRIYEIRSFDKVRRTLLTWWMFRDENQPCLSFNTVLETEHIFATKLAANRQLSNPNIIELPGNITLLEKTLNRKAQNFTFADKAKCYSQSHNVELRHLAETKDDFTEADILERNQRIVSAVIDLLKKHGLFAKADNVPTYFDE